MSKELIKHAAVKAVNGWVFMAKCHAECFEKAYHVKISMVKTPAAIGFVTSTGRFIQRGEAAEIALASGQITTKTKLLFSEHLWDIMYDGTVPNNIEKHPMLLV